MISQNAICKLWFTLEPPQNKDYNILQEYALHISGLLYCILRSTQKHAYLNTIYNKNTQYIRKNIDLVLTTTISDIFLSYISVPLDVVYFFKTPSPKAGRSVRFASSPVKSGRRLLLGPTNLKSTVGQYSRTDHTNTVKSSKKTSPTNTGSIVRSKSLEQ